jgi:DNA-binding CsgD family transcriptional regulator
VNALAGSEIAHEPDSYGGATGGGACLMVPVLVGEDAAGLLGLGTRDGLPPDAWREEILWAAADLLALLLPPVAAVGREIAGSASGVRLTRRQRDVVLELVEHGGGNEEIAAVLGLSARTVKIHLQAAYRQFGVRGRGDLIRLVLSRHAGWLQRERERRRERDRGPGRAGAPA